MHNKTIALLDSATQLYRPLLVARLTNKLNITKQDDCAVFSEKPAKFSASK